MVGCKSKDQILLMVKSKEVAAGFTQVSLPSAGLPFRLERRNERRVRYERILDDEQRAAVSAATELALESGRKLVVQDVNKANPLIRAMKRLIGKELRCDAMLVLPCNLESSMRGKKLPFPNLCIGSCFK